MIELPLKHPELFESLGIAQPKVRTRSAATAAAAMRQQQQWGGKQQHMQGHTAAAFLTASVQRNCLLQCSRALYALECSWRNCAAGPPCSPLMSMQEACCQRGVTVYVSLLQCNELRCAVFVRGGMHDALLHGLPSTGTTLLANVHDHL